MSMQPTTEVMMIPASVALNALRSLVGVGIASVTVAIRQGFRPIARRGG
jgi:hypothetical protein